MSRGLWSDSPTRIVRDELRAGPKTNAELAAVLGWWPYEVASMMAKLRHRGNVEREIGPRRRATYRWVGA